MTDLDTLTGHLAVARERLALAIRCLEVAKLRDGRSVEQRLISVGMNPITADEMVRQASTFGLNWESVVRARKRHVLHLQRQIAKLKTGKGLP